MPPPVRTTAADYHYYTYDYDNSQPFQLSQPVTQRNNMQFYSMEADLQGLLAAGQGKNVPNIALTPVGPPAWDDDTPRNITVLSFGGAAPNSPAVLITGGIHAREWIAPAIAYLIAEYLIMNYTTAPANVYQTAINTLINNRRIVFIPLLNPNGNNYSVFSEDEDARDWRKNRRLLPSTTNGWIADLTDLEAQLPNPPFQNLTNLNPNVSYDVPEYATNPLTYSTITIVPAAGVVGVDLNRNYDTPSWAYEPEEALPTKESYFGPNRASEVETQNVANFVAQLAGAGQIFETAIDYHSFHQAILYPTETSDSGRVTQNYTNLGLILQRLIATSVSWNFIYNYKLGTPLQILNYNAVGSISDHDSMNYPTRAFTIELDPSSDNPGFLLPEDKIMGVFEKNIRAALALIAAAGQQSTVTQGTWRTFHTITSANELQFLTWNVFGRGNQLPT